MALVTVRLHIHSSSEVTGPTWHIVRQISTRIFNITTARCDYLTMAPDFERKSKMEFRNFIHCFWLRFAINRGEMNSILIRLLKCVERWLRLCEIGIARWCPPAKFCSLASSVGLCYRGEVISILVESVGGFWKERGLRFCEWKLLGLNSKLIAYYWAAETSEESCWENEKVYETGRCGWFSIANIFVVMRVI